MLLKKLQVTNSANVMKFIYLSSPKYMTFFCPIPDKIIKREWSRLAFSGLQYTHLKRTKTSKERYQYTLLIHTYVVYLRSIHHYAFKTTDINVYTTISIEGLYYDLLC